MITLEDYFGKFLHHPDVTETHKASAASLLAACAQLESYAIQDGVEFPINLFTKTGVSGSLYGGFRPKDCKIGAPNSSHKEAKAVDLYDPLGKIDQWCFAHSEKGGKLEQCGIYLEHPSKTNGWSHWTIRAPVSKNRVFLP